MASIASKSSAETLTVQAFIFYDVEDRAFERAAKTMAHEIKGEAIQEFLKVKTKNDFLESWKAIRSQAENNSAVVVAVHVFTHASKQDDQQDGLEFAQTGNSSGTLTRSDIEGLPRLPWADDNQGVHLYGCNTGLIGEREWAPGSAFTQSQRVTTYALTGFGYFSSNPNRYVEISNADDVVYLYAYKRGRNGLLGDGSRMKEKVFKP
ncbi:hypothetical protein [Roseiconus lacunae]|uniref:hypothetical protein n=1 Tax=Roseiconus lacunae TaxID=2605694 RepID=UPI0011F1E2BE|nr:hypothetical protein [Roseiconus lacunae]